MAYNGWKNYETWNVKLWLDNDQGTYTEVTDHATEAVEEGTEVYQFADWLKDYVEETFFPEDQEPSGMAADLLNAAKSEVDWFEIAEAYLNDAKEEAARS